MGQVTVLRKSGQVDEAYALARQLLQTSPDDRFLKGEFGWVLYAKIKSLRAADDDSPKGNAGYSSQALAAYLREYVDLGLTQPDMLFSFLMIQVVCFDPLPTWFPKFVSRFGITAFRPEDFASDKSEDGKAFEPLVVKVALALGKVAERTSDNADASFALSFIDDTLERAQVQKPQWLLYRRALLLSSLGRTDEAETILLSFVKDNDRESWAWHALALVEERKSEQLALSVCAMGQLKVSDPVYGLSVTQDLARLAASQGHLEVAKWAAELCIKTRMAKGYKLPEALQAIARAAWFAEATPPADPKAILKSLAADAADFVHGDATTCPANYLGSFEAKDGRKRARFGVRDAAGRSIELVFLARDAAEAIRLPLGGPVTLRLREASPRQRLIGVNARPDGSPLDCLETCQGLVDRQDGERMRTYIYLGPKEHLVLNHADVTGASKLRRSDPVSVSVTRSEGRLRAYAVHPTPAFQSPNIRQAEGTLRLNPRGFGFIDPDIFVPPDLAAGTAEAIRVRALAVLTFDEKKQRPGWRAVRIEPIESLGDSPYHRPGGA